MAQPIASRAPPSSTGTAAWLYKGARVGIRQTGGEPLVLIIAYPNKAPAP